MSPFDALGGCVISTVQSIYGSTTAFTYSRAATGTVDAVDSFLIEGALNAGGEYANPDASVAASLFVRISDIPLGPLKGDRVVILNTPAKPLIDGTYKVQDAALDKDRDWATLALRLISR